jgi:DNA-binding beta-propeller fold protein YncE
MSAVGLTPHRRKCPPPVRAHGKPACAQGMSARGEGTLTRGVGELPTAKVLLPMSSRQMLPAILVAVLAGIALAEGPVALGAEAPPLQLEDEIALGSVRGRVDHMAIDLTRNRLFVAALGQNSLAVVDLALKRTDRLIGGLSEPQGVGFDPISDMLYVANGGDGSVMLFKGPDLSSAGRIELGSDADNIRIDSKAGRVFVGHGDGALTVIDASNQEKIASTPLKAHPESFQIDAKTDRIFVNVPKNGAIEVIDSRSGKQIESWATAGRGANFAMALDHVRDRVLIAFRRPAELGVFSAANGKLIASVPTCGDVDDIFVDAKRDRIYVSCGEGFVDVLAWDESAYRQITRIATAPGARTSLFVPELDRLLLAVPAKSNPVAAIWVFRPSP